MRKIIIYLFLSIILAGCQTTNPKSDTADQEFVRLDTEGYLYYMDYTEDYYGEKVGNELKKITEFDTGCSTFFTYNFEGQPLVCRNYDYPHRVSEEDRTLTGLNIILHCKPEGKYESIAVADAIWCDTQNPLLSKGGPDMPGFTSDMVAILPYQCMDGVNEKGLCVSILRVDIKEGEQGARIPAGSSILLRYILDDCSTVEEAIEEIRTSSVKTSDWQSCHFFLADAQGNRAVAESRNGILSIIESDVITNFYLGSDDIADAYRDGKLREAAVMMTDSKGNSQYHFGYGHGYHRFVTIAAQVERFKDTQGEEMRTVMSEEEALVILRSAVQNPHTNVSGVSMTQYSVIYNNALKTVTVWPFQNYKESYSYDVTGGRK